jgi:hypothetical protein
MGALWFARPTALHLSCLLKESRAWKITRRQQTNTTKNITVMESCLGPLSYINSMFTPPTKADDHANEAKKLPFGPLPHDANDCNLKNGESGTAGTGSTISGWGSVPSSANPPKPNNQNDAKGVKQTKKTTSVTTEKPTTAADDRTKTKSEENQNNENQSVWNGYVGTKIGVGAALLAAGIALKLTLIGIVPGLIMAGAGAAIMVWGAVNYMLNNNNEEKKA